MTDDLAPIDPARTALLLMDLQAATVAMLTDPQALLACAADALAWARKAGVRVCFVRVGFTEADFQAIPARNKTFAALAQQQRLGAGSPETQIHPSLEVRGEDIVVRKTRVGAFSTTGLGADLRAQGIDTLILAGIATSGVVLSTLRDAADADYRLYVLSDVTADRDPEVHRVLTEKVFPRQADVITTADLHALAP